MSIISVSKAAKRFKLDTSAIYKMVNTGILTRHRLKTKRGEVMGVSSEQLADHMCQSAGSNLISICEAGNLLGLSYSSMLLRISNHNIPTYNMINKRNKEVSAIKLSEFNAAVGKTSIPAITTVKEEVVTNTDKKYVVIVTDNVEEIKALFV